MVGGGDQVPDAGIVGANFHCHCALSRRRHEFLRRQVFGNYIRHPQAMQARRGQYGAVAFLAGGLAEAGIDVAPDGNDFQIGAEFGNLRGAAGAAGADARAGGVVGQCPAQVGHQGVARVGARRHRSDGHARRQGGRQILKTMHRQINIAGFQAALDFGDENPQPHSGQGRDAVGVASGGDGYYFKNDVRARPAQGRQRQLGLGQGEAAAPGADPHYLTRAVPRPGRVRGGHGGGLCRWRRPGRRGRTSGAPPGSRRRCRQRATPPWAGAAVF